MIIDLVSPCAQAFSSDLRQQRGETGAGLRVWIRGRRRRGVQRVAGSRVWICGRRRRGVQRAAGSRDARRRAFLMDDEIERLVVDSAFLFLPPWVLGGSCDWPIFHLRAQFWLRFRA